MLTSPMTAIFTMVVILTDRSALSGKPAPRFCPTRVAAALLMPQAGKSAKRRIRMAMVYPARAAAPKTEMILIKIIHELVAIMF